MILECIQIFNSYLFVLIITGRSALALSFALCWLCARYLLVARFSVITFSLAALSIAFLYGSWLMNKMPVTQPFQKQLDACVLEIKVKQRHYQQILVTTEQEKWLLSLYGAGKPIAVGDCFKFDIKPKLKHQLHNPHDLFKHALNLPKTPHATVLSMQQTTNKTTPPSMILAKVRSNILQVIADSHLDKASKRFIAALTLGKQEQLSPDDWQILQRTGTAHLFAISGLHLSIIAFLLYRLASVLGWISPLAYLYCPKYKLNLILACIGATLYSLLSGFSLPAQRALCMLVGFTLLRLLNLRTTAWQLLQFSALLILLLNPSALLSKGFWLSFTTVAILIYVFSCRLGKAGRIKQWAAVHWFAWLGTLGLNILFFQKISLVGLLANVVAIPIIAFIVAPAALLGCLFAQNLAGIAITIWQGATIIMQQLWSYLCLLSQFNYAIVSISHYHLLLTIIGVIATFFLCFPRYLPQQGWSICFILPLLLNKPPSLNHGVIDFTLLDVGQGLSCIVRTAGHTLVYDTGPKFLTYDTGKIIINPYLTWFNTTKIDAIVISHWDNDHSGGLNSILEQFPTSVIYASANKKGHDITFCEQGIKWEWDDVQFEFLYPNHWLFNLNNNSSCVLQITTGSNKILLPGDIEAFAETVMLETPRKLKSTLLVAPHHGSKTSSTWHFVQTVHPKYILYPVGFQNRFNFPHLDVTSRYQAIGSKAYRTDHDGAIRVLFSATEPRIMPTS